MKKRPAQNRRVSIFNSLMSFVILGGIVWLMMMVVDWGIIHATWVGNAKQDCHPGGACWAFISQRWEQFIYGFYPWGERYRVTISMLLFMGGLWLLNHRSFLLKYRLIALFGILLFCENLLYGHVGFKVVPTHLWGGLFLTIVLSVGSIACSFPIALLLALGRNSSLVIIKTICVFFIETIRGVPLITILFMASVMLPLFVSQEITMDKLLRAFVGITVFESAYLAEVMRGGLNSVVKGQREASRALGLSYSQMMAYIILPQALRISIPGIVNSFIALFKDTTLVLLIGVYDFLGIVQATTTDPHWLGISLEAYVFCAAVYWVFCFSMSQYSKKLEKSLNIRS